ncbi:Glu/Leu/Phe/Val dehydrogenase [Phaeobacter sp. B1627]|uniref:Glu/Leu/Phe/Val family dehydrogenase n=1 Tax=Phaeobacter sp. B1627 TaxID=2583809 RepID=UPI001119252D|nr:Glu/Leu/Phe/Val dehydrogenase dimerization domain-containing protein [Phaeobacter sp. B1627]TNJ42803.1 Glu/Leu/Phe/Val dehydrogenase [Phaeobacter sp. B1627]
MFTTLIPSPTPGSTHEAIYRVEDPDSGLLGLIALHSTQLGPAAGGLRMRPYTSFSDALEDVSRLSAGMTYKNAAAGLPLGGGKAVILGDPTRQKTPELLRAFGRALQTLHGRYITAEDMGMSPQDMALIREETPFVAGLPDGAFASGDPSPITARGIFNAILTAHETCHSTRDIAGRVVSLQGLGHVGWHLAGLLRRAGAKLIVTDTDPERIEAAVRELGAVAVAPEEIYDAPSDIFAPCAIGGILNQATISRLKATMVVGGANNQLATPSDAQRLHERGILYAPDFVANGGGIINVATEILKIEDREGFVQQKLDALDQTLRRILTEAQAQGVSPDRVAIDTVNRIMASRAAG